MIETIADLKKASRGDVEAAVKSIDFKGLSRNALLRMGTRKGMTQAEWEAYVKNLKPQKCEVCDGTGEWMPKVRTVGTIHASKATRCVTSLYYDVTGEIAPVENLSVEMLVTYEIGHSIHRQVQKALHLALGDDRFQDEVLVDLPEALICGGSCDGIALFPRCRCGLEIKTISGDEFNKLRKPKSDHIVQAAGLYAKGLDLPFMSFLYVSKGWPHDMKEYPVIYDESVFNKWYLEKGGKVEDALEKGKPPTADASGYECKQCGYVKDCPQAIGFRDAFKRR